MNTIKSGICMTARAKQKINYMKKILQLVALLPVLLLSSCLDDMFQTPFAIQFPEDGGVYIGDEMVDFVITYDKTVSQADIFLNGFRVGDKFSYGKNSATGSMQNLRKFLIEGENVLSVDPMAFGPTARFVVDTEGPDIIVNWGVTSGGQATIGGFLRDATEPSSLRLDIIRVTEIDSETGVIGRDMASSHTIDINSDDTFFIENIDVSSGVDIYSFTATDVHGHVSKKEYLADSDDISTMAISNALRMAIGDSFVESLRPIIASGLYTSLREAPIDVRNWCWDDPNKDGPPSQNPNGGFCGPGQDGSTFNPGLNPVSVDIGLGDMPTTINRVFMDDNATVLLNRFKVEANDRLDIDLVITELTVDLTIDGGWFLGDIDMEMTIGRMVADTGADVTAQNKNVNVQLRDSNFSMENVSVSRTTVWGIPLGGLVDLIMPLIEGLIADMLPGILNPILNDNLEKIVIGAKVLSQDDLDKEYFEYALNVETIKTDNLFGPGNPYDMIVGLETVFNLLEADPLARPTLGPVFVDDPVDVNLIYNSLGETGTNLSLALSSNALNQAFASLYSSGLFHFTLYDGEVSHGADPSKPAGTENDMRTRLYPQSPPFFTLRPVEGGSGAAAASIGFDSAVLYMDEFRDGAWRTQLRLETELSIAAQIDQVDNAVRITIDGQPKFIIHDMENNTGWPVTQGMLQNLMDTLNMYFWPELSDNFITIDLDQLADTSLNGTVVAFQSDRDTGNQQYSHTIPCDGSESQCINGYKHVCDTLGVEGPTQSGYDLICHEINLGFSTSTVTSTGDKGTNLFFQMEARDPNIPAAPAVPRFDLDGDGIVDYRDNCSVPLLMLLDAVDAEGGLAGNIDEEGNPIGDFEERIKERINLELFEKMRDKYDHLSGMTEAAHLYNPPADEIAWWNHMRKGDDALSSSDLGDYPWIRLLYANPNQMDSDGDRIGELCEDDDDRDGIYTNNGSPRDTCPQVYDPTNDPGSCTIDIADFVLFKNMNNGQCLSHNQFNDTDESSGTADFFPGQSNAGSLMTWETCNTDDLGQRFYVEVADADENHDNRFGFSERIIHIYTNEWKQIEPGFYDTENFHYLAATIANTPPVGSNNRYWQHDDVIVTTMSGYDGNWRQWILSASGNDEFPFLIESFRVWDVYGRSGGLDEGRRDCIMDENGYNGSGHTLPSMVERSCFPNDAANRERASFQVLLGHDEVPWLGRFSVD